MAHVFEVPGSRDFLGVREDTVMEVLTPVIDCQLALSENIFPEMQTNDGLNAIHVGEVKVPMFSIRD